MGNYYRKLIEDTVNKNIPFIAMWEFTDKCNLKCLHCYHSAHCRNELDTAQSKLIVDSLADSGVLFLMFTGGEALLRPDFVEIASYARKKKFALKLLTNGTLIDLQTAKKLADIQFLTIEISIYGKPGVHDRITGVDGSFEKAYEAIRYLHEQGQRIVIKMPILNINYREYDFVRDIVEKYNTGFVFDPTIISRDDKSGAPLQFRLNDEQLVEYFSKRQPKEGYRHSVNDKSPMCGAGRNAFAVSSAGDIYPCIIIKEKMGNLLEEKFNVIWQSEHFNKYRKTSLSDLKVCVDCNLREFCTRCVGTAIIEDGDFFGCSTAACRLAKIFKLLER